MKTDGARGRGHDLPQRVENVLQRLVVPIHPCLQLVHPLRQFLVREGEFAQPHESPDNRHTGCHGNWTVQHARKHDRAMFREGDGRITQTTVQTLGRKLRPHVCKLLMRKLKGKIARESVAVASELLLQALGQYPINPRQGRIQHDALPSDSQDQGIDPFRRRDCWFTGHIHLSSSRFLV